MFGFKKKEKTEEMPTGGENASDDGNEKKTAPEAQPIALSANASSDLIKLSTELDRMKASIESFGEVRKALNERIATMNQQIGELRAMILDRDRTIQEIELKAVKAADLVESVQPDKLMIEMQKEDAKFEALKANLEGNEAIQSRVMEELKEMRKKLDFFRGIDEIIKLAEEVKKELIEIKRVEANVHIDTDKVNTIYAELRRKFQDIDMFSDSIKETKVSLDQNTKDVDFLKIKISGLVDKNEMDKLVSKVQKYIDALHEINKSSSLTKDITQLKSILEGIK